MNSNKVNPGINQRVWFRNFYQLERTFFENCWEPIDPITGNPHKPYGLGPPTDEKVTFRTREEARQAKRKLIQRINQPCQFKFRIVKICEIVVTTSVKLCDNRNKKK